MNNPAKILVVDDEDAGRFVKGQTLKRAGYDVIEAATGREALELAAKEFPDLVVLDVNLPDISGLEVCRRLRVDEYASLPGMQILQISNTADHASRSGARAATRRRRLSHRAGRAERARRHRAGAPARAEKPRPRWRMPSPANARRVRWRSRPAA